MARHDRIKLIQDIEKIRNSRILCLLTSDRPNLNVQLQKDILPRFVDQLRNHTEYDRLDLFVFTLGGDTQAGFGLARLLREYAPHVSVLIPDKCHSAGTLIALGANEIVMTKAATLSPIDPSISGPLNPAIQLDPAQPPQLIPLSVESVAAYQALVQREWKINDRPSVTSAFAHLADKVHPLALGDVFRARQQIELLATQLLKQHRKDQKKINSIVHVLSKSLGSHDYLIYRKEAQSILGTQVKVQPDIENLLWDLYKDFADEMQLGVPFDPKIVMAQSGAAPPQPLTSPFTRTVNVDLKFALIESAASGERAVQRLVFTETLIPQPGGGIISQGGRNVVFAGWEKYN